MQIRPGAPPLFLLPVPTTTLGAPSLTRSLRQGWDTTKAPVTIRKMPKGLVRYHQSGQFHFLTFSCYRRLPLLDSSASYSVFEYELERVRQRYGFVVAGYVLMPEHVHLLVNDRIAVDRLLAGESVARGSALAGGPTIMLPHPSRKGRGLDGAQSIEGEPAVKNLTGPPANPSGDYCAVAPNP